MATEDGMKLTARRVRLVRRAINAEARKAAGKPILPARGLRPGRDHVEIRHRVEERNPPHCRRAGAGHQG